jgi:hypothetical protein
LKLGIEKPVFNRFVVGKRVYQRNYLAVEFMANNSLFVSAYVTNVGSIGLDAPYHHMYEWGTTSLFSSLGQIHKDYIIEEEKIK